MKGAFIRRVRGVLAIVSLIAATFSMSGQPASAAELSYPTLLTVDYDPASGIWSGQVAIAEARYTLLECEAREVTLKRPVEGEDEVLATVTTDSKGHWSVDLPVAPGPYYAATAQTNATLFNGDALTCLADETALLHVVRKPSTTIPKYYVSTAGSDHKVGSKTRPWRTIEHALAHIRHRASGARPILYVQPGMYIEQPLRVENSIAIIKKNFQDVASPGSLIIRRALPRADPDRMIMAVAAPSFYIRGATFSGDNNNHFGLGIWGSEATIVGVKVEQAPFGIVIFNSPDFLVKNAYVTATFAGLSWVDIGLQIAASDGRIVGLSNGPGIDHVINFVGARDDDHISEASVEGARIEGSRIWWADGIRIIRASVTITDCEIIRPPDAQEVVTTDNPGQYPYSGIEIASNGGDVVIRDCYIEGFDTGIAIAGSPDSVLVENTTVASALRNVIETNSFSAVPTVDLGGGTLGSLGNNSFLGGEFAILHHGSWGISAKFNEWGNGTQPIGSRIWDKLDDPKLGLVTYQ